MPFTNEFKDKYVAPGISAFTAASIPEAPTVGTEHGHWLGNYILNSWGRATLDDAYRRSLFNFLRRVEAAFRSFAEARMATMAYLAKPNSSGYFVAIGHWEVFLSQAYQAWWVLVGGKPVLFREKGSLAERLNYLYGVTKHIESAVKENQFPPDGTLPVWLTNDGLQSVGGYKLSFEETAEILEGLGTWADAAQDPATMTGKIMAAYGLTEADLGPGPAEWYGAEQEAQSIGGGG